jgi:alanyl-tRNA synthetase
MLHRGHLKRGSLALGQTVRAEVATERRNGIRRAHSATHILHHALQQRLGNHAQQQGSKVDDDWLRFDFSNPSAVTAEQLAEIERDVNQRILAGDPIQWRTLPLSEARSQGAMMLFGEKYPDVVRMVSMGAFSKELCGGTHLDNTAQVGLFKITREESVAAGVRRIEAVTGIKALEQVRQQEAVLRELSAALRVPPSELPKRVDSLQKELRDLRKLATTTKPADQSIDQLFAEAEDVGGAKLIVAELRGTNPQTMRQQIDQLRRKNVPIAVFLATREGDKVQLVAGISRELEKQGANANEWIREPAALVGGSGGGRPDMAQAGGKHPDKLEQALVMARELGRKLVAR